MIGKPEWFIRRKYTGWGLTPKTWQGWVYILAMMIPLIVFQALPDLDAEIRTGVTVVWIAVFALDAIDIMRRLKKDEREGMHEAFAERNAAWFMVVVLAAGLAYELGTNAEKGIFFVDPFIAFALFGAVVVKGFSIICLEKNG